MIEHPTVAELGSMPLGTISGVSYGAADFETGVECRLGSQVTWAARPWADLPDALRGRLSVIRHRTFTNAHPEFGNVMKFHGAVKGPGRIGTESLPAMIAQETFGSLGTALESPMQVAGPAVDFRGGPIRGQDPENLALLFSESGTYRGLSANEFADYRDSALDAIYRDVRTSGTHAQRRFLDEHARSRADARALAESLGPALAPITEASGDVEKQVLAAVALIQHNVTPVVIVDLPFGDDNHQDAALEDEVTETIMGVGGIRRLWDELTARGLEDRVTFAYLSVFGRTLERNGSGGRNHHGSDHAMVMFGPHVTPGVLGGLIEDDRSLRAGPIGDVAVDDTLSSAGKTLAKACGVPDETIEERIVGGRALA
jgi:uncharacterized protein (DUF1501 family)